MSRKKNLFTFEGLHWVTTKFLCHKLYNLIWYYIYSYNTPNIYVKTNTNQMRSHSKKSHHFAWLPPHVSITTKYHARHYVTLNAYKSHHFAANRIEFDVLIGKWMQRTQKQTIWTRFFGCRSIRGPIFVYLRKIESDCVPCICTPCYHVCASL